MRIQQLKNKQVTFVLILSMLIIGGCGEQSGDRAMQGGSTGAVAGAVGGLASALIFGGDVADTVARGAVWGGSTGAVSGAIVGHQEDKAIEKKQLAEARVKLKNELGEDGYEGLVALTQCKHTVAQSYAEIAKEQKNAKYQLAGYWLELVSYADLGDDVKVDHLLSAIIEIDKDVHDHGSGEKKLDMSIQGLENIRKQYGIKVKCK